jgi:hypothetical protein
LGELGARAASAERRPEVELELVGRLAGGGKRLHVDDATNAHVDAQEVMESDLVRVGGRSTGHSTVNGKAGFSGSFLAQSAAVARFVR